MMLADLNQKDLTILGDLMQTGKVTPVIDRRYKLSEVPEAIRYLEQGHARGKVVITVEDNTSLVSANLAAGSVSTIGPVLIASELIALIVGVTIVPHCRRTRSQSSLPAAQSGKKPYRWGLLFQHYVHHRRPWPRPDA